MAALTAIAAGAAVAGGGIGLYGSAQQARAMRKQGDYQKDMSDFNSDIAKIQARDAIYRGDKEAKQYLKKASTTIGSQRAALAAQGVDVSSGSALDIQEETAGQGALGALTIRNNAWREAWGYKVQAETYSKQGFLAREAAQSGARSTMLTGVSGAFQSIGSAASAAHTPSAPRSAPSSSTNTTTLTTGGSYNSYGGYA